MMGITKIEAKYNDARNFMITSILSYLWQYNDTGYQKDYDAAWLLIRIFQGAFECRVTVEPNGRYYRIMKIRYHHGESQYLISGGKE